MKKTTNDFFWPSFTDLMSSLFFIMLILYVLTFVKLKNQQQIAEEQRIATQRQLNKIKEIEEAASNLPAKYFTYSSKYRQFSLNEQIQFGTARHDIPPGYNEYLTNVGNSLTQLVSELKDKYSSDTSDKKVSYLVVIEGMASNDSYKQNDELSYQRALSLYKFWKEKNILFDSTICDLQIAGSGTGGMGRYTGPEEYKNQRFIIQIIPKISM